MVWSNRGPESPQPHTLGPRRGEEGSPEENQGAINRKGDEMMALSRDIPKCLCFLSHRHIQFFFFSLRVT